MKGKWIPTMIGLYEEQRRALSRAAREQHLTWSAIVRQLIDKNLRLNNLNQDR